MNAHSLTLVTSSATQPVIHGAPATIARRAGRALLGAALVFAALGAQAQTAPPAQPLTRAEVRAELLRAQAAGELPSAADLYGPALGRSMAGPQPATRTAEQNGAEPTAQRDAALKVSTSASASAK